MPPWWTEADEADARSSEFPETPHLTLQPPEPDAPAEEWEPFNRECEELERIGMAHYEANVHRWRCRNCAFWESEDGRAGLCVSYELTEAYDEPPQPTTATDGHDCPGYFSRTGPAA